MRERHQIKARIIACSGLINLHDDEIKHTHDCRFQISQKCLHMRIN